MSLLTTSNVFFFCIFLSDCRQSWWTVSCLDLSSSILSPWFDLVMTISSSKFKSSFKFSSRNSNFSNFVYDLLFLFSLFPLFVYCFSFLFSHLVVILWFFVSRLFLSFLFFFFYICPSTRIKSQFKSFLAILRIQYIKSEYRCTHIGHWNNSVAQECSNKWIWSIQSNHSNTLKVAIDKECILLVSKSSLTGQVTL